LKPLYAADPDELVSIFSGSADGRGLSNHSYADYLDYRQESASVLSGLPAFTTLPANLIVGQGAQRINLGLVSDDYLAVLGLRPIATRGTARGMPPALPKLRARARDIVSNGTYAFFVGFPGHPWFAGSGLDPAGCAYGGTT
jgi:hypothetical protein